MMMHRHSHVRLSIPATLRHTGVWLALAVLVAWAPAAVRAEAFIDLYGGAAFPQGNHADVHTDNPAINCCTPDGMIFRSAYPVDQHFHWETSPSVGLRGGYWFTEQNLPFLGMGLDLSYYRAFQDTGFAPIKIWAVPLTPMLMLRIPIGMSERYPGGRVQPYIAGGPGFTIAAARADLSDLGIGLGDFEDTSFDVGADARAGIQFQVAPHLGLFSEYRYTYLKPRFRDTVSDAFGPPEFEAEVHIKPKLETHHVVFGLAFTF
jgi:hypothetical protein